MLPKINDVPKYSMVIPSTKKKVTYRPFLVKEQKVLLIAMESQDEEHILRAIVDTLESCIETNIDYNSLATFDVEYMFTQIRGKSVGESTTLLFKCEKCNVENEHTVDLSKINIVVPKGDNIIILNDTYSIQMKYPTYTALGSVAKANTNTEMLLDIIVMCMDALLTEDERISFGDHTQEEILEFVSTLTSDQFQLLSEFVLNMPKLKHDIDFTCASCGTENKITLEGLQDFFQ